MIGGDMGNQIKLNERFEEKDAKFYVANICQAVGFLH